MDQIILRSDDSMSAFCIDKYSDGAGCHMGDTKASLCEASDIEEASKIQIPHQKPQETTTKTDKNSQKARKIY